MVEKHNIIFFTVLLVLGILLVVYINLPKESVSQVKKYSDNPRKWIESNGNVMSIDIESATANAGYLDSIGLQYNDREISTAFRYSGFYKGNYFDDSYSDENGKVLMRISKDMNPNDGVIEGFIIERIKDGNPIVYAFVDEDWKKNIGRTYIRYGRSFEKKKIFAFNEISNGIYMDSFEDSASRFIEDYSLHLGGVIIGDVSDEKIDNGDTDITLMKIE